MNSICAELILRQLSLDESGGPKNRRLYECLKTAILEGSLAPMTALPSSRELALELGASRNTVTHAYEQLRAEGYIDSRIGSGTYVASVAPDSFLVSKRQVRGHASNDSAAVLSTRASRLLANVSASPVQWGAFMPGVPDVMAFPSDKFGKLLAKLWRSASVERLTYAHGGGDFTLRAAIAEHLQVARGVQCSPEDVLVTEGVHQAIDLCVRMLADPGDTVWVEEPGYWGFHKVLQMDALNVRPLYVEDVPRTMLNEKQSPKIIFVTPSHQYPLGTVMSLAHRRQLIDYAKANRSWIVEDDYDSEFRFSGRPIPAMQGLDAKAPVIYVGTFSKTLFPGLRIGYVVLPKSLGDPFRLAHADLYREGHLVMQAALAQWMREGHYVSHIRRMRLVYARRRAILVRLIQEGLGSAFLLPQSSNAGLHLVLSLPADSDDAKISRSARQKGILTTDLSRYYHFGAERKGLVLGYACVQDELIEPAFKILRQCVLEELPRPRSGKTRRAALR